MRANLAEAIKLKKTGIVKKLLVKYDTQKTKELLESYDEEYQGTALYWICVHGYSDIAQRFLNLGANVNTSNAYGHTALHAAADMGHSQVVHVLLKYDAKVNLQNQSGQTPLHLAAYRGYSHIVQMLLTSGADCTLRNHRNMTAIQEAITAKCDNVVTLLVNQQSQNLSSSVKVALHRSRSDNPNKVDVSEERYSSSNSQPIAAQSVQRVRIPLTTITRPVYTVPHQSNIPVRLSIQPVYLDQSQYDMAQYDMPPPYYSPPPPYSP